MVSLSVSRRVWIVALALVNAAVMAQAAPIVAQYAHDAFTAIHDAYPVVTGRLQRGLTLTDRSTDLHTRWTLRNDVDYAKIFETGGATLKGPKPHGHVFSRLAPEYGRQLRDALFALVTRATLHG